jgi:LSD1 subclass zinc finger protein
VLGARRAKMLKEFRCKFCHRLLAKLDEGSKVEIKCPKCKTMNLYQDDTVVIYEVPENNVTKKILERGVVKYDLLEN